MYLVFDIETDEFKATVVHCNVVQALKNGEILKFASDKLFEV